MPAAAQNFPYTIHTGELKMEQLGLDLKNAGQSIATSGTPFVIRFAVDAAIKQCAETRPTFTSEHVRETLGHLAELQDVSRVIGARMSAAARRGEIVNDGRTIIAGRKNAHARRLLVWHRP